MEYGPSESTTANREKNGVSAGARAENTPNVTARGSTYSSASTLA